MEDARAPWAGREYLMRKIALRICLGFCVGLIAIGVTDRAYAGAIVPFKASDTGSATVVGGSGSVIQTADTGRGNGTDLGRFTLAAGEMIDLTTGAITHGFFTLTAANGDTVTGTYSGQALTGFTGYVVSGPITAGTGRFAVATGFLVWRGTLDPLAFTFSDNISGMISTRGS